MRKVGVELAINEQTLCILAGELDNDDNWDEIDDTEFRSNLVRELTVEISNKACDDGNFSYVYTLRNPRNIQVCLIDLENGAHLCDYVSLQKLFNIKDIKGIQIVQREYNSITLYVLNETIMIKEIKLISFKNKESIIQFLI